MLSPSAVEVIGYLGSALVVVSLSMTSVVRLRTISLLGSTVFGVYAILIGSIPILFTNVLIALVNIWFLFQELTQSRDLGVVRVPASSPFLVDFLDSHIDEIRRNQPTATERIEARALCLVLTRDGLPAGAVIGEKDEDVLHIDLDFVIPAFRDSRLGLWLYASTEGTAFLRKQGIAQLDAAPGSEHHVHYLRSVGFSQHGERFTLALPGPRTSEARR